MTANLLQSVCPYTDLWFMKIRCHCLHIGVAHCSQAWLAHRVVCGLRCPYTGLAFFVASDIVAQLCYIFSTVLSNL